MNVHDAHTNLAKRDRKRRICRGPGSGNGKFGGKGMNGCKSRSGYAAIRGHEGGQMPLFRRLPNPVETRPVAVDQRLFVVQHVDRL